MKNGSNGGNVAMQTEGLLNEHQAADRLGLKVQTLRNWRHKGTGPEYVRLEQRAIRYSAGALEAYIATSTVKPAF
jgi:predicted DNA-binding transcriptional regulator AlpA